MYETLICVRMIVQNHSLVLASPWPYDRIRYHSKCPVHIMYIVALGYVQYVRTIYGRSFLPLEHAFSADKEDGRL